MKLEEMQTKKSSEVNKYAKKLQNAIVTGDVLTVRRLIKGGIDVNSQTFPLNTWVEN